MVLLDKNGGSVVKYSREWCFGRLSDRPFAQSNIAMNGKSTVFLPFRERGPSAGSPGRKSGGKVRPGANLP